MISPSRHYEGLNLTFNTTEECNLRCKYCYELDKNPRTLPDEYAFKFIDLILTDDDPIQVKGTEDEWLLEQGVILDFIGGDSLMDPEQLDRILSYFIFKANVLNHRWANRWRTSISTNGTLLGNPKVRTFCNKYSKNLSLGISIDGCPTIHDLNRVFPDGSGSMNVILENWEWYRDFCVRAGIEISTKATLNAQSIPYLLESIKYMHETLGINYVNMNFAMEDIGITEEDLIVYDKQLPLVIDYIEEHREDLYVSLLAEHSIGHPADLTVAKTRCGSGRMPSLGVNGHIYPCFRYLPHTLSDRAFDMSTGNIWDGFNNKDNFRRIECEGNNLLISDEECLKCPIESACPYCIAGCYAEFGKFKRTKYICEIAKITDKWARELQRRGI